MALNLLPWREAAHRKRLRQAGFYLIFGALVAVNLWLAVDHQNTQQRQQLASRQSVLDELNQQYHNTTSSISRLRQSIQDVETLQPLGNPQILEGLQVLGELPMQQGELRQFQQVYQGLSLEGIAHDQTEFEQLHHYLKQHFSQVKLSLFQPEEHALRFRFDVQQGEKIP